MQQVKPTATSTSQYSPTPPVIRLLYWSMRRAVSLPYLSYLFICKWKSLVVAVFVTGY